MSMLDMQKDLIPHIRGRMLTKPNGSWSWQQLEPVIRKMTHLQLHALYNILGESDVAYSTSQKEKRSLRKKKGKQ